MFWNFSHSIRGSILYLALFRGIEYSGHDSVRVTVTMNPDDSHHYKLVYSYDNGHQMDYAIYNGAANCSGARLRKKQPENRPRHQG